MKHAPSRWRALVASVLVVAATAAGATDPAFDRGLIAVVDAGSSGTRLHLYRIDADGKLPKVTQLLDGRASSAPPLSSYAAPANRAEDAGPDAVGPLLQRLGAYLASHGLHREAVAVHVLGTAGMRAVPADRSAAVYASAARTIAEAGYRVGQVTTIAGDDEARYAWFDVNYLHGTLVGDRPTLGIIEIGGASAQVAVAVQSPAVQGTRRYRLNGRTHQLLTVSYLGLGQNEARRSMLDDSAASRGPGSVCYPNRISGESLPFDTGVEGRQVDSETSAFTPECFLAYDALLQRIGGAAMTRGEPSPAILATMPDVARARLVGISLVQYVFDDWRIDPDTPDVARRLRDRLLGICEGPDAWTEVRRWLGGRSSVPAQNACANGAFVYALLFGDSGLRLRDGQILFSPTVPGANLAWARGAALVLALGGLEALEAEAEASP